MAKAAPGSQEADNVRILPFTAYPLPFTLHGGTVFCVLVRTLAPVVALALVHVQIHGSVSAGPSPLAAQLGRLN